MITRRNVSLRELGWEFSYDKDGKYPLSENENVPLVPGEVIELYFRNRPKQDVDGHFYGTAVESSSDFPFFFFNMFKKRDKLNTFYLFGIEGEANSSLSGKIESFSLWSRKIEDSKIVNYHTNASKMIGNGIEYLYQTEDEAIDDGLKMHYVFDDNSSIVSNFTGDVTAVKNRRFDVGSGKTTNSSIMNSPEDVVFVDRASFYKNFTMNFRFYIEDMDDFTLFYSQDIGHIKYDVVTSTFDVELYPHIGNEEVAHIQKENLKVHTWYDLSIRYEHGMLTADLNSVFLEDNTLGIEVGGIYSLVADNSNFESIEVDSTYTYFTSWKYKDVFPVMFNGDVQPETDFSYSRGRKEFINMMIGESRDMNQSVVLSDTHICKQEYIINDILTDDIEFTGHFASMLVNNNRSIGFTVSSENSDGINFKISHLDIGEFSSFVGNRCWTSMLLPHGYVKIKLTVKNTLVSTDAVFPMIYLLPGTPLGVHRVRMEGLYNFNVLTSDYERKNINFLVKENYATYHNNVSTIDFLSLDNEPTLITSSSYAIQVYYDAGPHIRYYVDNSYLYNIGNQPNRNEFHEETVPLGGAYSGTWLSPTTSMKLGIK